MNPKALLETIPQVLLFVFISPAVMGMLGWITARIQGRAGPSPLQPYRDLWKLFHRRAIIPETASWVFLSAPFVVFGCYLLIGALTPVVYLPESSQIMEDFGPPLADFLAMVALIGLARFSISLAGMDTGSPFGGMGASRGMFVYFLTEPTLVIGAYAMALNSFTTSLPGELLALVNNPSVNQPLPKLVNLSLWMFWGALLLVMLAEAGRIPFDNPASNLEVSMLSKAIQMEYGGFHLATLQWAEAMRITFFMTLLVNLALPGYMASALHSPWVNFLLILSYPLKLLILVILLAWWEVYNARLRLSATLGLGGLALAFAMFAVFLAFVMQYFNY